MAVTEQSYTGNGSTTNYAFTFPYLESTDVEVQVDATVTTAWTFANATTVQFNTAPANGAKIKILRKTNVDNLTATFYAGSAIKSEDLNDNFTQNLYSTQETSNRAFETTGGTFTGDITLGEDVTLTFEGATANAHETTLTVADPTADRTITLPNVTGTVITTGDSGTVATGMIAAAAVTHTRLANDAVDGTKLADDSVNSEHYVDGSIDTAHISDNAITNAKLADNSVSNAELTDNAVNTAEIQAGAVTTAKILNDAVTGAKIADDAVDSEHYTDGSIDTAHIGDAQVTSAKIANQTITGSNIAAGTILGLNIQDQNISTPKIADLNVTTAKLADSSVTTAKIAADQITTAKIVDNAITSAKINAGAVGTSDIAADAITAAKIADNAVGTEHIADAELTTLAGMQSGTASILAGSTALAATLSEINAVCDGKSPETTISNDDTKYPTSGAVVDYVTAQIAPIGGLEVIADEDSFPAIPAAGVVISIADVDGIVINSSGVCTTARTSGNGSDNVTINGFPTALRSKTLSGSLGLMVSSTGSSNTYNYHKLLGKEDDIEQLSQDISDFGNRYRVHAGEPSSNNDDGDLVFDTNANKMKVYDATASAWKEVTSSGDFKFLVPVDAGTTTAATWDGSDTSFDLKESTNTGSAASITSVYQLIVSLNGVIQKPNSGSWSASGEGFYLTDSDTIRFATAPPTGSSAFIIQVGSAITPTTPADNTVSTAKIQSGAVTQAKIAKPIDLDDNEKIRLGTGNDLELFHSGSHSYIKDTGTGSLVINTNSFYLNNAADDETLIKATENGAVELYHNAIKVIETHGNGAFVYGPEGGDSNIFLYSDEGDDAADRWKLTSSSSACEWSLSNVNNGSSWETNIKAVGDGAVELYHDNTKKIETTSAGVEVTGTLVFDSSISGGTITLQDDQKLFLGAGNDLKLWHDGSHSYIQDEGTGALRIRSDSEVAIQSYVSSTNKNMAKFVPDGAVELYHNDTKKFETTSSGINIGGNLAANPFDYLRFGASQHGAADIRPVNETNHKVGLAFYVDGTADTTINPTEKVRIQAGGGISFNGDTAAANALDDYEQGNYTPTVSGSSSGSGTLDGSYNILSYTKIGNLCTVSGRVRLTSENMSGTYVEFTLPFTSANLGEDSGRHTGTVMVQDAGEPPNGFVIHPRNNQANLQIARGNTGSNIANATDEFSGDELVSISFTYRTA